MRTLAVVAALVCLAATPTGSGWDAVFAGLNGLARSGSDRVESPVELMAERRLITTAIVRATTDPRERAALLAAGHAESLFAWRIGRDECKPWECDGGAARGYWQVHEVLCPEAFVLSPGEERLRWETDCALRFLRFATVKCGTLKAAVSGFTGDCSPRDRVIRDRAFDVAVDVLARGSWPVVPQGWGPAGQVPAATVRAARAATKDLAIGETAQIDGFGVLVDWHWHDPSSRHTPKGWHRGLTFFRTQ